MASRHRFQRVGAAALCAALGACATAPAPREYRLPPPVLSPPAAPIPRVALVIATSVEHVEPLSFGGRDASHPGWTLSVDEPLREAFAEVAASLSSMDPALASSGSGRSPDATLFVRKLRLNVLPPVEIELESTLATRDGTVLASVTRTGWGPKLEGAGLARVPAGIAGELSAAIESAAGKARDALAVAPRLVALQRPPTSTPTSTSTPTPTSTSTPTPDLRPKIAEFWDLRWPADRDPVVAARVETLASRRSWSVNLALGGAVSLGTAALFAIPRKECAYGACTDGRVSHPEAAAAFAIVGGAALVAAIALWPGESSWREVVNLWNGRHPDQPLELAPPPAPPQEPQESVAR